MKTKKLIIPYILWMFVFTLVPMVLIISNTCRDDAGNFTLVYLMKAFNYKDEFLYSLWVAFLSILFREAQSGRKTSTLCLLWCLCG